MRRRIFFALALSLAVVPSVSADPASPRAVEIRFAPGSPGLQIAVWIEDAQGKFIDTAFITRVTGQFGLANRPGEALLKTAFGWPYGRREMVLPVWAHRRNVHYPKVVMGGACGNSPSTLCPDGMPCAGNCEDSTIAYHGAVSSTEPFYCAPNAKPDAMSCASPIHTLAKGAYADAPAFSLYPPRADLMNFAVGIDGPDAKTFASKNDLVAISGATPPSGKPMNPVLTWYPPSAVGDGDYVAWIEMSQEADFNASHNHPNKADSVIQWDFEGHPFLGQPSVLYRVPFRLGSDGYSNVTSSYAGYGSWDGSDGNLNPPDGSITVNLPGSGAGRLLDVDDGVDKYRVKVVAGGCQTDGGTLGAVPQPVTALELVPSSTSVAIRFHAPTSGVLPNRYAVRYRQSEAPITDAEFNAALSAPDPPMSSDGTLETTLPNLIPTTTYSVAVRGISPCGQPSPVVSRTVITTMQQFVVLHGCFVATAAYGSPLDGAVARLRDFRDRALLDNSAGRLFVAAYYGLSPSLANAIAGDRRLRALARAALSPLSAAVAPH